MLRELDTSKHSSLLAPTHGLAELVRPEGPCNACVPSLLVASAICHHMAMYWRAPETRAGGLPPTHPLGTAEFSQEEPHQPTFKAAGIHSYTEAGQHFRRC